jgi:hypothetical protein
MPRRSLRRQIELAASITNISPKGAQLSLRAARDLPTEFTLRIPGATHCSRLIRKLGCQAGVEFIGR